jgi:hypothetical protein
MRRRLMEAAELVPDATETELNAWQPTSPETYAR